MKNIALTLSLLLSISTYSQDITCATDEVNDTLGIAKMNRLLDSAQLIKSNTIYTIPLVVHIMNNGDPLVNISDEQILSAIVGLNEDFRKMPGTNGDGIGVDTEIEFCLATIDPDGNPTDGINRIDATVVDGYDTLGIAAGSTSSGGVDEVAIKNLSRWDTDLYYNVWIVSEIRDNDGGSGVQGYAYFPNSSAARDGTVILYNAFGTVGTLKSYTNLNRVTTHELGHAFFLYHTFHQSNDCIEDDCETQGDRVCDTPVTWQNNQCFDPACDGTQMVENYMDYTQQVCMNAYTQGQKDRARAAIETYRPELLTSPGCGEAPECIGDINSDGDVDINDFILFNSAFGNTCSGCPEDIDGNGIVNIEDFIILNSFYGTSCGEGIHEPIDFSKFDILGRRKL